MALIRFDEIDNHGEGLGIGLVPFWCCDACGEKITQDRPGIALFERDDRGAAGLFRVVHKGGFPDRASSCETPSDKSLVWKDLGDLMYELFKNSGFTWADLDAEREPRRQIGLSHG